MKTCDYNFVSYKVLCPLFAMLMKRLSKLFCRWIYETFQKYERQINSSNKINKSLKKKLQWIIITISITLIQFIMAYLITFGIYIFTVNNRNTRKRCAVCSKLTIMTPEQRHWRRSGVFIINFEHISHLFLVFLLLTLSR